MSRLLALYRSAIGKKAIAAVTGLMMLAFLILHVIGNLKVFVADPAPGVPDIDVYARYLRTMGEPLLPHEGALWIIRIGLLGALGLHVLCVSQLALLNRAARPVAYAHARYAHASRPALWMLYTGALIGAFIAIHIMQFTTGTLDAARFTEGAVYANLYRAFHVWYYVALYVVAMAVIALHLYHGAWSLFQSLGRDNPDRNRGLRALALALSVGLFLAFTSVPAAIATGVLGPPPTASGHAAASQAGAR